MTLLIACLLIYGFGLPWWLYPVALAIWVGRSVWAMKGEDRFRTEIQSAHQSLSAILARLDQHERNFSGQYGELKREISDLLSKRAS